MLSSFRTVKITKPKTMSQTFVIAMPNNSTRVMLVYTALMSRDNKT